MKNTKILLDTSPWAGTGIKDPFSLLGAFFDFAHLDHYKEILNEMMFHISLPKSISEKHADTPITMYTAFHSLLRMAYVLKHPSYTLIAQPKKVVKHLRLGSMTNDEYENPLIVYQRAFEHHTL